MQKKEKKETKAGKSPKKKAKGNFKAQAKFVIAAVAPVMSSLQHLVGEKLSSDKIKSAIPKDLLEAATAALTRGTQYQATWNSILTTGDEPPADMSKAQAATWKKEVETLLDDLTAMIKIADRHAK